MLDITLSTFDWWACSFYIHHHEGERVISRSLSLAEFRTGHVSCASQRYQRVDHPILRHLVRRKRIGDYRPPERLSPNPKSYLYVLLGDYL